MYDQIREDIFIIMFYTVVATMALMASCYLLFRDGNAFAADITPPVRLRRWVAAFFASIALNHAWYMPIFFLSSAGDVKMTDLVGGLLDSMTFFPLGIIVLLVMLQDRRRPLWPIAVMMTPIVAAGAWNVVTRSYAFLLVEYVYALLMCIGIIIYMVHATRQYGRWLRDNYADLEHKEVWQSFVVLVILMIVFAVYAFTSDGPDYQYTMQVIVAVLICYLLWRVETLSDLSIPQSQDFPADLGIPDGRESDASANDLTDNIGLLLQQYCVDTQLYLQHDLTLIQLAKTIGTNRSYLSQYFSNHGTTYNAYINDLRIDHFIMLYREAASARQPIIAQQLALDSGYRSYITFGRAFKQRMGQSVTSWMHESA